MTKCDLCNGDLFLKEVNVTIKASKLEDIQTGNSITEDITKTSTVFVQCAHCGIRTPVDVNTGAPDFEDTYTDGELLNELDLTGE